MRKYMVFIIILLVIVSVSWVGLSVYDAMFTVEINPNAESYLSEIDDSFDRVTIEKFSERVDALDIQPTVFLELDAE